MFKNHITIAIRNILKYKTYSLINILGLTIGLVCTILILLWVQDELSMDGYHEKKDDIYHAYLKSYQDGNIGYQSTTSPAIATILTEEYPEIINAVRMGRVKEVVLKTGETRILEGLGGAADPSIFDIFTFPIIAGDPKTALNDPLSIVLTESMAKKYFGKENPIGKTLRMDDTWDLIVTGVLHDLPPNTYQQFDFLVPFSFLKEMGEDIVGSPFFPCRYLTFVELADNANTVQLREKIEKRMFSEGKMISFTIDLIPFTESYLLDSGGRTKIAILAALAFVILGIACVNFMNLATARSVSRRKEIGIRKVTGASRGQLARQFLSESTFLAFIAAILAIIIVRILLASFNAMTGKSISLHPGEPIFIFSLVGLILFTGLIAGIYPALYLSGFNPIGIFRNASLGSKKSVLRRALIVTQFALSIGFMISAFVMNRQINFMRHFNLGVNQNNVAYMYLDGDVRNKSEIIKRELLEDPNIEFVTTSSKLPIDMTVGSYYRWGKDDNVGRRILQTDVSYDYVDLFDLQMVAGRFYSEAFPNDAGNSIIVNEAAIRAVGLEDPVSKPFFFAGKYYTLIGVFKDFHHNRILRQPPEPLAFWLKPEGNQYMFAKIAPHISDIHAVSAAFQHIQDVCNRFSPERPLRYQYLSDYSYRYENTIVLIKKIVLLSTIFAIFVSCLGLFGLSLFVSEQKTKEIGVRKVLGASVAGIVGMLSKEFTRWVIYANLIAWPIAWFAMNKWLQNYAYRVSISWEIFIFTAIISLGIAVVTVASQAIKSALANPIESLRYE
ncbi:ABC transporter permease [candidate division KSB1 bacterium]|nr:ABC transporter permease [candidate division KSB1 bacterium]